MARLPRNCKCDSNPRHRWPASWINDFIGELLSPRGWKFVAKGVIVVGGFVGFVLAFLTYRDSVVADIRGQFEILKDRLRDGNAPQRASAIRSLPDFIAMTAPPGLTWKSWTQRKLLLEQTQAEIVTYIQAYGAAGLASVESIALLAALERMGQGGFVTGEAHASSDHRNGLRWMWLAKADAAAPLTQLQNAFADITLEGLRVDGRNLEGITFVRMTLPGIQITNSSSLANAHIDGTRFVHGALIHSAVLDSVSGVGTSFCDMTISSTSARSIDLSEARFERSFLVNVDFSTNSPNAPRSRLNRAQFIDTAISDAGFRGIGMQHAIFLRTAEDRPIGAVSSDFSGSDLSNTRAVGANFQDSIFSGATMAGVDARHARFAYCKFDNSTLDGADFSNADLTGCQGLAPDDNAMGSSVRSAVDLNISATVGLTAAQIRHLQECGARSE